jgi:DNA-binding PadR family transcriptional regulator
LQGTLDLLILRALSLGGHHGLGISRRVQQITDGTFDVRPGSPFGRSAMARSMIAMAP